MYKPGRGRSLYHTTGYADFRVRLSGSVSVAVIPIARYELQKGIGIIDKRGTARGRADKFVERETMKNSDKGDGGGYARGIRNNRFHVDAAVAAGAVVTEATVAAADWALLN